MPRNKTYQWHRTQESLDDDRPSRSQKKRDSTQLQGLGEELSALAPSVLESIPLSQDLRGAILEWQQMGSRESRRRQMQYIGRLMREEPDVDAISQALAKLRLGHAGETLRFRQAEALRTALMEASPVELGKLLEPYGQQDELRDLIARARNEQEHSRPPHAFRLLFRKLREAMISEEGHSANSQTPSGPADAR